MSTTITSIDFQGDTLIAAERPDGVYVAITPICNAIGISADRQRDRIQRDTVLAEGATKMGFPSMGGMQETFCLRLDLLNGWLFGSDDKRVKDEARERVLAYKRQCYRALAEHFLGTAPRVTAPHPASVEPLSLRLRVVTETRHSFGSCAAREMWMHLGLPVVPSMIRPAQGELFAYTAERRA